MAENTTPGFFARIHWPQTIVLCVMIVCMFGSPIAFFMLVPAKVLTILVGLPWLTILGPGLTAFLAALAAIRGFLGPALLRAKSGETTQTTETTVVRHDVEVDNTHEVGP